MKSTTAVPAAALGKRPLSCKWVAARTDGGVVTISERPARGISPAVAYKPTYSFTIDGTEQKATEACAAYLVLLQRMVAEFEAEDNVEKATRAIYAAIDRLGHVEGMPDKKALAALNEDIAEAKVPPRRQS